MAEPGGSLPEITLVANDVAAEGGMERQLRVLITGLVEAGHRVTVISRTCALPPHPRLRWIRVPGPARPFALTYPFFLVAASVLVALRARGLVHATGAIVLNRTTVTTVHFCHSALADLPGFSRASKPGFAYRLNGWIARWMSRAAERWCYRPRRVRRLVGVSAGVGRELRQHFPAMGERIEVIPNGVDTDAFAPPAAARNGAAPDRLQALFIGSEWKRKGLRVAIEALAGCPQAELTVVGRGDAAGYERLAVELGVADRVSFAGPTTDAARWFQSADLLLLPTVYETFSLVTYEAAACGLPLLVTRVNGVEDLIRDGVNGWVIERDADQIAARLRQLAADPELRRAMGEAARRDSLEHSWARVIERYRALYAELAAETSR